MALSYSLLFSCISYPLKGFCGIIEKLGTHKHYLLNAQTLSFHQLEPVALAKGIFQLRVLPGKGFS